MRLLLILLLVCNTSISAAQKISILQGKWRAIAVSQVISPPDDSLYYDIDKDSIYIPSEDFKEAGKDGLDSMQTINLFKSMYASFKHYTLTFAKDSVLLEYKTSKAKGTYLIKSKDTLDMYLAFEEKEKEHLTYTFFLTGDLLNILLHQDMGYTRFAFKKE